MIIPFSYVEISASNEDEIIFLEQIMIEKINDRKFDDALIYADKILDIDPENVNALNNKGGIFIELELYENAVNNFDSALRLDVNNTGILNNKGIALIQQQKVVESFEAFYKSLTIDPTNQIAYEYTKKIMQNMNWVDETNNGYAVLTIRDANGNLVGYTRANSISVHLPLGYNLIKEFGDMQVIDVNGEKRILGKYVGAVNLKHSQLLGMFTADIQFGNNKLETFFNEEVKQ